jgi:hypothetical protein
MKTFAITRHVKRTVIAGVLAITLLGTFAAGDAAAQPIDPDRGPGTNWGYCKAVNSYYHASLIREEAAAKAGNSKATAYYSVRAVQAVSHWYSSGCQANWGSISSFDTI